MFSNGLDIFGNGLAGLEGTLQKAAKGILRHAPRLGEGFAKRADLGNRRDYNVVTAFRHALVDDGVPIFLGVVLAPCHG